MGAKLIFMVPVRKFHCTLNPFCMYLRTNEVRHTMQTIEIIKRKAAVYLRQGMSPRRLALTLVLGFVVGCIPVVGLPTAVCAVIALAFRLNQPAIQVANYLAMPFQMALIVPLLRLGGRLIPMAARQGLDWSSLSHSPAQMLAHSPQFVLQFGGMASQALVAWLLLAIPVVVVVTPTLAALLRRVPVVAAAECGD
jgi:uncharacterized protein (DUF2062 family)